MTLKIVVIEWSICIATYEVRWFYSDLDNGLKTTWVLKYIICGYTYAYLTRILLLKVIIEPVGLKLHKEQTVSKNRCIMTPAPTAKALFQVVAFILLVSESSLIMDNLYSD